MSYIFLEKSRVLLILYAIICNNLSAAAAEVAWSRSARSNTPLKEITTEK